MKPPDAYAFLDPSNALVDHEQMVGLIALGGICPTMPGIGL